MKGATVSSAFSIESPTVEMAIRQKNQRNFPLVWNHKHEFLFFTNKTIDRQINGHEHAFKTTTSEDNKDSKIM